MYINHVFGRLCTIYIILNIYCTLRSEDQSEMSALFIYYEVANVLYEK